jgi:6-phosphogluconolactonase
MAREELLSRVSIPVGNIHPIPTERITPQAGAQIYENELKEFYGSHELDAARPLFDATLLGLGTDGHTASLFPDTPALAERRRWVAPVNSAGTEARITLTYPALDSSRAVAFLVEGKAKQTILARYRAGDCSLPASHIAPIGSLHIFADRAAAGELT